VTSTCAVSTTVGFACYVVASAGLLELLLVLGFSVERFIAIRRPFEVCNIEQNRKEQNRNGLTACKAIRTTQYNGTSIGLPKTPRKRKWPLTLFPHGKKINTR